MFVIGGFLLGAFAGGYRAKARGGKTADMLQYAFVHGLILAILGLFVTIGLDRMLRA